MAVTTMWRGYYDALPQDPLAVGDDAAIPLAQAGLHRARVAPYRETLHAALSATASLADTLRPATPENSLWHFTQGRHPAGFRLHPDTKLHCGECAWAVVRRNGKLECRQTRSGCTPVSYSLGEEIDAQNAARFDSSQHACEHHEPALTQEDCFRCGACCHKGFDVVEVAANERFAKRHPELIEVRSVHRCVVPRPDGRCVALAGTGASENPFLCRHYGDRPRSCRNFERGGDACLVARQRTRTAAVSVDPVVIASRDGLA